MLKRMKHKRHNRFNGIVIVGLTVFIALAVYFFMARSGEKEDVTTISTLQQENLQTNVAPLPQEKWVKIQKKIKRGDTIIELLKKEGVDHLKAYEFFMEVKPVYDLRRIGAGKKCTLLLSQDKKEIHKFIYEIDLDDYLEVVKGESSDEHNYVAKLVAIPYTTKKSKIRGNIQESLFAAILKAGEKPELADMMASLYEFDVDFNRDIRKNDTFSLIVEKMYLKGRFVRYGEIEAAEFVNRGQAIQVIRYTDPEGHTAYYHPDGRSVRKMFLRCPLPFMRVTSSYGNRRHPVLGFSARHLGIDLGAPRGTKVRSTASGIVQSTGYNKIRGRYVTIRHKNRYETQYFHLSRIYKGIKRGKRVIQGQIIGYVGSTGRATGPHLHYGLKKSGRHFNPLKMKSPTKNPVKKRYLPAFKQFSEKILQQVSFQSLPPQPLPLAPASPYFVH